ncbi:MAG: Spy/CpxP family protein refolding chaperone [Sphingobacterium sp.]
MKKLFLTASAFLLALSLSFAQEASPEDKAKQTVTEWTTQLTLTEEQQAQIYDIVLEHKKAKFALKSDTTAAESKAQQVDALNADLDQSVNNVLTDEQKPLYAKIVESRASKKPVGSALPQPNMQ